MPIGQFVDDTVKFIVAARTVAANFTLRHCQIVLFFLFRKTTFYNVPNFFTIRTSEHFELTLIRRVTIVTTSETWLAHLFCASWGMVLFFLLKLAACVWIVYEYPSLMWSWHRRHIPHLVVQVPSRWPSELSFCMSDWFMTIAVVAF